MIALIAPFASITSALVSVGKDTNSEKAFERVTTRSWLAQFLLLDNAVYVNSLWREHFDSDVAKSCFKIGVLRNTGCVNAPKISATRLDGKDAYLALSPWRSSLWKEPNPLNMHPAKESQKQTFEVTEHDVHAKRETVRPVIENNTSGNVTNDRAPKHVSFETICCRSFLCCRRDRSSDPY